MKLIAIDLDDTLLREDLTVSDKNIESIRIAKENGHRVILASGRGPYSMKKYAKVVGVDSYIVAYNGAVVIDLFNDQVIYEKDVPSEVVEQVLQYATEHNLAIQTYEEEAIVASGHNDYTKEDARLTSMNMRVEEAFADYVRTHPPIKLLFPNSHELLVKVEDDLKELLGQRANVFFSKPIFLEVMHPENNKYLGVKMVADRLGISEDKICCIGDSMNDFEMIRDAYIGIAMANARKEIKAVANHILESTNDEDGVTEALEYIGALKKL